MRDVIHIALCTDKNYAMPVGVAMISILENRDSDIHFHVILTDEDLCSEEIFDATNSLKGIASKYGAGLDVYSIDNSSFASLSFSSGGYISKATYARLLLPQILPDSIDKLIYLDGDIIVLGALDELWNVELASDVPLAAAPDIYGNNGFYHQAIGLPQSDTYFNAGVLVMNLACWRNEELTAKTLAYASSHKLPFMDQDTINGVFHKRIQLIPLRFNTFVNYFNTEPYTWGVNCAYLEEIKEAISNPVVIHYSSHVKPWQSGFCPKQAEWERYFELSPWKNSYKKTSSFWFESTPEYYSIQPVYQKNPSEFLRSFTVFIGLFEATEKLGLGKISFAFNRNVMLLYARFVNLLARLIGRKS